jgi:hypothetical protein
MPILMNQMRISTYQVSSVVLRPEKLEIREKNCKNQYESQKTPPPKNKKKYYAKKLSQIRRWIELCMREIILRFEVSL